MRAQQQRGTALLLAALLLMQSCCAAPPQPAAAKGRARRHATVDIMDAAAQKEQSLQQQSPGRIRVQQVAPLAPLNPDCVPKYVTDLVLPPPMPVAPPPGAAVPAEGASQEVEDAAPGQQQQQRQRRQAFADTDEWEFSPSSSSQQEEEEEGQEFRIQSHAEPSAMDGKQKQQGSAFPLNGEEEQVFRIQSVDFADAKRKKASETFADTDDWEFSSVHRHKQQQDEEQQQKAKKHKKAPKAPTLEQDYYASMGMVDDVQKPKLTPISDAESTKSDLPDLSEQVAKHELNQRGYPGGSYPRPDYTKYPKYPKYGYPPAGEQPEEPAPVPPPANPPPVMPPPVVPPPVNPPPVVPPPTNPPPVVPPPTNPPPVNPPPVVPPPVNPPPVNPPPVNPPPVNPPPVNPPPVNPPPVNPPPVNPPPVNPPPVNPPPVNPPPVVPPPVNPPPVVPPPAVMDFYQVSAKQVQQPVLPPTPNPSTPLVTCPAGFTPTSVLAYGPANIVTPPFHNWPGFSIEAMRNVPAHITWINDLKDAAGNYLPHPLRDSIDQTINWANPAALGGAIDSSPCYTCSLPGALVPCSAVPACVTAATTTYTGPVPTVTHVHGQTGVYDWADGYPEAWVLPAALNLAGYFDEGTWSATFEQRYTAVTGAAWAPGSSVGIYRNTQRPSTSWYHDTTLGLSRQNVFAGLSGFYFVRDKFPTLATGPELPGIPYPAYDGVVPLGQVRELPLAIQDRSFTTDSQLWYPVANNPAGSTLPAGVLHPRWIPEYSATVGAAGAQPVNYVMMTVNGRTYPRHAAYPDAYRLRILNGCNSRTLQLRFARSGLPSIDPLSPTATANLLPFFVIGNEAGWYPQLQLPVSSLEVGPGERYDVIIDFSGILPGQFVFMLNNGPETDFAVYDGTNNGVGLTLHTAQIMRFDIQALVPGVQAPIPFDVTQQVALDAAMRAHWAANVAPLLPNPAPTRQVALMEKLTSTGLPVYMNLGTASTNGLAKPTLWVDPVTTDVALSSGQYWDIINLGADAHPIHLHNVDFQFLGRWAITINPANPAAFTKTTTPVYSPDLDPWLQMPCDSDPSGVCSAPKDTLIVLPGSYTRIGFNTPPENGLYVWNCHLLEHGDNEMRVPFCFGQPGYPDPRRPGALMCPGPN